MVVKYLKATSNVCLKFRRDKIGLVRYCDSYYDEDLDGRKSSTVLYSQWVVR